MKKIYFIFINLIFITDLFAQSPAQNLQKYWYYRERLKNNYILVDDCIGCGVTAVTRGFTEQANDKTSVTLNWGDATIDQGWYISVLATEYGLIQQGKYTRDINETIKELYYALKAFNRLDETAEMYTRCNVAHPNDKTAYINCVSSGSETPQTDDFNGFFIRDDVPTNFVSSNLLHFNQGINATQLTNQMTVVRSDRMQRQNRITDGDLNPVEESVDQVLGMLMGLALVSKFIPDGVNYNNLPLNDVNGNTDIQNEAQDIVHRMVLWIRDSHVGALDPWVAVNPASEMCVANIDGDKHHCSIFNGFGNFQLLSYGLAAAAEKITGANYQNAFSYATEPLWQDWQINCPITTTSITILGNTYAIEQPQDFCDGNAFLVWELAAVGNSWHNLFFSNTTEAALGNNAGSNGYEYLCLLRQVLHGGGIPVEKSFYENLLNAAPANGPYKFSTTDFAAYNWSAPNSLRSPLKRGSNDPTYGEYYGVDYMLLYNLYLLASGFPEPPKPNCTISLEQPDKVYNVSQDIDGTEEKHFKNSITTKEDKDIVIKSGADVWWTAGDFIELNPGFEVEAGANFTAEIIDCNEFFSRMAGSDTTRNYNKAQGEMMASKDEKTGSGKKTKDNQKPGSPSITIKDSTANEKILQSAISINPNPSSDGKFNLACTLKDVGCMDAEIAVMNVLGETIHKEPFKKYVFPLEINLSSQPKGTYFIKIQNAETVLVYKVVSR